MAILSQTNTNTWVFSLKVLLISTAVFSLGVILKLSVPVVIEILVSGVPQFWSSLLSWLTPPYLYVVLNCIIITIAASSRYHHLKIDEHGVVDHHQTEILDPLKITSVSDFEVSSGFESVLMKNPLEVEIQRKVEIVETGVLGSDLKKGVVGEGDLSDGIDEFVISRSNWTPNRRVLREISTRESFLMEKPLVSTRFGHKKTVKSSPEGAKPLGVSKPKRHETLESTWKTITDGRSIPLTRHLKKSDTWETHGHHNHQNVDPEKPKMKKLETPSLTPSPVMGKLKKEPSLSQDELNRRVEAFINKFNEEMRLQRQESLNQYKEMVNRRTQ
ncbi:hypothetical protein GIB67_025122 [Kingdonia uniflora]|uniref:DUF4408 domain-containing protein n=1 Tax=Kingdonia uniflora TaxID=39325 RepID=A0A7J7N8P1_9MAGN|nr:hypothetical protein GIB67_025122 [Kingdonia uniflora]